MHVNCIFAVTPYGKPVINKYQYDVCLSFAGEDRAFVKDVAMYLRKSGVRVFYDEYEEVNLWGKNLYEHLKYIYSQASRFCVIFISEEYIKKAWTKHENRSAQERAISENSEYILPARFSDINLPSIFETTGYIDIRKHNAQSFADIIQQKVMPDVLESLQHAVSYYPANLNRLFTQEFVEFNESEEVIEDIARSFFYIYERLRENERLVIASILGLGCPAELPEYTHLNSDMLERYLDLPSRIIDECLISIRTLGFIAKKEVLFDDLPFPEITIIWRYIPQNVSYEIRENFNYTDIAYAILSVVAQSYCPTHFLEYAKNANFMALSEETDLRPEH